jgi:type IV pilus assembly protein PilW
MKLEFGVDTTRTDTTTGASLTTTNANTGKVGDGVPDNYTLTPALADYANTVSVRVDLLVRNAEKSTGYTDNKTYNLGVDPTVLTSPAWTITAPGDAYRRHVYAAEVRLVNLAGRKENP